MAERLDATVVGNCDEPAEPAPRDILQEDALDGLALAELEYRLERWPVDDSGARA